MLGGYQVFPRLRARSLIKVHYAEAWCIKGLNKKEEWNGNYDSILRILLCILDSRLHLMLPRKSLPNGRHSTGGLLSDVVHLQMTTFKWYVTMDAYISIIVVV